MKIKIVYTDFDGVEFVRELDYNLPLRRLHTILWENIDKKKVSKVGVFNDANQLIYGDQFPKLTI